MSARALVRTVRPVALALALGTQAADVVADGEGFAGVPLPPGGGVSAIGDGPVLQNGLPLSIAALRSALSPEELLTFYRERWAVPDAAVGEEGYPGFLENELAGWSTIGRLEGGAQLLVQLRPGPNGGSEGFLSSMPLDVEPVPQAAPLPAGGENLSTTASVDAGRAATTTIASIDGRVGEVAADYRDRYLRDGWTLAGETEVDGAAVLRLSRRGARVELIVADGGRGSVTVVSNEVSDAR